jgi:dTDP-4-dehydrorhamnose 3,5-epimerase
MNPPKFTYHPEISGLKSYELDYHSDDRGLNFEILNDAANSGFSLDSCSMSKKGVLRGFHGDFLNYKLIQCLAGEIQFIVIDVNKASDTYLNVKEFILNAEKPTQILVPPQVVNAHLCLSEKCTFFYKWTYGYVPINNQIHVKWNDERFKDKFTWLLRNPILSERDK